MYNFVTTTFLKGINGPKPKASRNTPSLVISDMISTNVDKISYKHWMSLISKDFSKISGGRLFYKTLFNKMQKIILKK